MNDKKLYSERWIWFASYIGGPLAGCYLMSKNFELLGKIDYAKKSFKIGIFSMALFFLGLIFVPSSIIDIIPSYSLPIIYTLIIASFVKKYQGNELKEHFNSGGKKYSGWKVTGISILSLIITLIYYLILVFVIPINY